MSKSIWLVTSLLVASCLLSACGQKGALYVPDETSKEQKKQD